MCIYFIVYFASELIVLYCSQESMGRLTSDLICQTFYFVWKLYLVYLPVLGSKQPLVQRLQCYLTHGQSDTFPQTSLLDVEMFS